MAVGVIAQFASFTGDALDQWDERWRPGIALSWQRCAQRGLSQKLPPRLLLDSSGRTVLATPATAHLRELVRPALEDLHQFIEGSGSVVCFADADGYLVEVAGDEPLLPEAAEIGWRPGVCWSEASAGTNGLGVAIYEAFPAMVVGEAHYCEFLRQYASIAAPVHDSLGKMVGVLGVLTSAATASAFALGMVGAAARALSGELRMNMWLGSSNELLYELNATLHALSEGILLLQPDGTVRQINTKAGVLLGVTPNRAMGRRLDDVIEVPTALAQALREGRELHDEEITFQIRSRSLTCLCTLREIVNHHGDAAGWDGAFGDGGSATVTRPAMTVMPDTGSSSYVLTLRSIDRVQRLVHRMSGAQARMQFADILGESGTLHAAVRLARIAAEGTSTVLLHGETGTGKEVFAQSIHTGSARAAGPFVAVNCAAIPRELINSELFGYEGGAFTGADRRGRAGKFELANGGTLFLDEIGDMPRDLQTALLRAIETGSVVRVGGQQVIPVDVRIIAATHKDLVREVELDHFRSDLYFRLNVFPIEVPPLRDRPGDVALLLRAQLQRLSTRLGRSLGIDVAALAALEAYPWPGNVRELENVVERMVYIVDHGILTVADLPEPIRAHAQHPPTCRSYAAQYGAIGVAPRSSSQRPVEVATDLDMPVEVLRHTSAEAEAAVIERALAACQGNLTRAATMLGISRTTLWRKMRRQKGY